MSTEGIWTRLNEAPLIKFESITKLGDEEFMIAPYGGKINRNVPSKLYKYHTTNNEWSIFIEDSQHYVEKASFAVDANSNELYFCKSEANPYNQHTVIGVIDIMQESLTNIHKIDAIIKECDDAKVCCLMMNNKLNVIGNAHYIWNDTTKKLETVNSNIGCVKFINILHITSRNILLAFDKSNIFQSQLRLHPGHDSQNNGFMGNTLGALRRKIFAQIGDWRKMDTLMPKDVIFDCNGMVLTNDERYVVLFDANIKSKNIYIFDLNLLKWKRSAVEMPFSGNCCAQLMGKQNNAMLVNGYIRMIILNDVSNNLINVPNDIANLLVIWYGCDEIHLFQYKTGKHWKIKLDHIQHIQT